MSKPVKIFTTGLLLVISSLAILYFWGKGIKTSGEADTRWLRVDMWPSKYFNPEHSALSETNELYVTSLAYNEQDKQALLDKLSQRKCHESNDECLTILLSVANILISEGEFEKAKSLENQAAKELSQASICPIKLEITLIKHAVQLLKLRSTSEAKTKAKLIVDTINKNKGINFNLQTKECNEAAIATPKLFHIYVMSVTEAMSYGQGALMGSAAYLRNANRINFKGL